MFRAGMRTLKASETRWIDHKIGAMGDLIEKLGLYTMHLQNEITATRSSSLSLSKTLSLKEEHADWKPASLSIEICL